MNPKPIVWTIAGTDPSGGAGIQADLRTLHNLGVHGCSVITAVLAQTAQRVAHIDYPSRKSIAHQLAVLKEDLPPVAVKTGMLARASTVKLAADTLSELDAFVVCDPVLRSSTGAVLLEGIAEDALRDKLFPLVDVLTPNLPEAEYLTGVRLRSISAAEKAAHRLLAMGVKSVLIKGGHWKSETSQDYWTNGEKTFWFTHRRLKNPLTHGSGCTLSSAIAAEVAKGADLRDAISLAKAYVHRGIRLGSGYGSLAHPHGPPGEEDMPVVTETAGEGMTSTGL